MKNLRKNILVFSLVFLVLGCSFSSEKGQSVGFVTHFSRHGVFWKSWELEINASQTGMTSTAAEHEFSIDNENEDQEVINALDSAQKYGWKVQIDYQQTFGVNCCNNRGSTSKFIKKVEILDKTPLGGIKDESFNKVQKPKDTVYMIVIQDPKTNIKTINQ